MSAVYNVDIFSSYEEINEYLATWRGSSLLSGEFTPPVLSNDDNTEDPFFIVLVRKWDWDNLPEEGPALGFLGARMTEHVKVSDKYDVFIYERV